MSRLTPKGSSLPQVTAWSYSRYSDYKSCPAFFKYKHLMRMKDSGSPAMARGIVVHKAAEDYIKGKGDIIPELENVLKELDYLKDAMASTEEEWGFKNDWNWIGRSGWFGDDVWFRAKTDVRVLYEDDTLLLGDWKTGKMYFSNEEQIELFALAGYRRFPTVTEVDTRLWYTDVDPKENEVQRVYTAKELDAIQRDWTKRVKPMFVDRKFAPTPSGKCDRCPFSVRQSGPCKF